MSLGQQVMTSGTQNLSSGRRSRVIAVLMAVFALDGADKGAIGAMALQLEHGLGVGEMQLGMLVTVASLAGVLGTIPFGWLVDRASRTRVLGIVVLSWGMAMLASAAVTSYPYLLIVRLGLGVAAAGAVPAVASLTGDFFPSDVRARMYGYILAGEFIGTGVGFVLCGELALLSWRLGFIALAAPVPLIAWLVFRLPEPARGGSDRDAPKPRRSVGHEDTTNSAPDQGGPIREMIRQTGILPRRHLLLDESPASKSWLWAAGYVLRIPTNLVLIVASALGYYFFADLRTFGVAYAQSWFEISPSAAVGMVVAFGAGALAGVLAGGRFADLLLSRRYLNARVFVTICAYFLAGIFLLPVFLLRTPMVVVPALALAGFSFGAVNAPLDAARLDIMHPYLWGRAESIRTLLRRFSEAVAPLLFGYIAGPVFGGGAAGIRQTFLVMLVPLFIGGAIGFIGFLTYPRDVATAMEYARRTERPRQSATEQR